MADYPFDDEYMIYDKTTHMYVLTAKCALDELSIDLTTRLGGRRTINPQGMINTALKTVSLMLYSYIYQFNNRNDMQNLIIARYPSARNIIKEALKQQLIYYLTVGNLMRSTDKDKRSMGIDELAKMLLAQPLAETGSSILFMGNYALSSVDYVAEDI